CSTRASRVSTAITLSSRLENTPANASTAKVSTAPPAPAATSGHGKSAGSNDRIACQRDDQDVDAAASAPGSACAPAAGSPATSVAFRSMVGGRRFGGPAGPPGGSLELLM